MEKYSCVIVEDEPLAVEVLEDYIRQVPFLELQAVCSDALFAMEVLQKGRTDVMFLDIHLPRIKGLDFVKTLKNPPQVIITSAYRDYAVESYELNVVDYLLKPVNFNRFLMAVNKVRVRKSNDLVIPPQMPVQPERAYLFINVNKKKIRVYLDEILFIESKKEYISIVTKARSYLTKYPLGELEEQLARNSFLRIHRSFIVPKDKIEAFSATEVEIAGHQVPIGRIYKDFVMAQLEERN